MAVVGRVLFSTVIDRLNQRLASALSFMSQAAALAALINFRNDYALIAACGVFGFSVGNLITLPSLIVQREFDPRSFGVLVSLQTAIAQVTYAFGPGVVGVLRDLSGELHAAVLLLHRAGVDGGRADHDPSAGVVIASVAKQSRVFARLWMVRRFAPRNDDRVRLPAAAASPPDPAAS